MLEILVENKDLEILGFQTSWDALGCCPVCEFEEEVTVTKYSLPPWRYKFSGPSMNPLLVRYETSN